MSDSLSFKQYQLYNNVIGWLVFAIAAFTYLATMEWTTSLWDTGEFIAASYKLQVVHPPGAPFFLMLNRIFTLFAPDPEAVGLFVNAQSALSSAFTILFLFWSITMLVRRVMSPSEETLMTAGTLIAIIGSGLVGALAYTWSDTFWFSAVEGEVYAMSSFFTAIVFWLVLKWERRADRPHNRRWIVLIAFMMGISVGVHLLSILVIPVVAFIYYFRKFKYSHWGVVITGAVGIGMLGFLQVGVIQMLPAIASRFDLLFVNSFGLPLWSGVLFFFILLFALIVYGIYWTHQREKPVINLVLVSLLTIVMGYTVNAMVPIRSMANPPIDMNNPQDVFSLISYLNREQYGDNPLLYGPYFTAQYIGTEEGKMQYRVENGKYVEAGRKPIYKFSQDHNTFFPRMWSQQDNHRSYYESWLGVKKDKPNMRDNLGFFFSYQMGHMYWRYFAWNFIGRQNDIQGFGNEFNQGNWISGIDAFDQGRVGNNDKLPPHMKNDKTRNKLYFLPLILGILGLIFHFNKDPHRAFTVLVFFIMTGIAIGIYLNMPPLQPRERDYAFVGSFYVFCIWVGMSVAFLVDLRKKGVTVPMAAGATAICLLAGPILMVAQEWDDHDRSNRYTARDFAVNYLESCDSNAVLFTNGDNDTYPLWYVQEVEGFRTDVRVVNLSLMNTDWYANQMRNDYNESKGLKFSIPAEKIVQGTRDHARFTDQSPNVKLDKDRFYDLKEIIAFIANDDPRTKMNGIDFYPTKKFSIPVDKQKVVANGTVAPEDADKIVDFVQFDINRNLMMKADIMVLDLIAENNWERPICWAITTGSDVYLGMQDYFQLTGMVYRLVPIHSGTSREGYIGSINANKLYDNVMNKFRWGNMEDTTIYMDYVTGRVTANFRTVFWRTANAMLKEGQNDKAIEALDKSLYVMPHATIPFDVRMVNYVELYYQAGAPEKARALAEKLHKVFMSELEYYASQKSEFKAQVGNEVRMNISGLDFLGRFTQSNGDEELSKKIEDDLNRMAQNFPGLFNR